ncbi:MarR family winged helix-turn-helix transcriptional regulator [Actinoplanes friuliensis]|uniref:MarR family transcriptional regulator n=1 Tax=Actinoplanes friuliensis DSM 7358 TaxID=1246995 RepID=U5WBR5_9ACTN|nr:MarR family transcriptional regulator [Actinoplanes friuliensis]AGZ45445.1 MarR family transcriptional regulator [Actinoplanes friuliensis DSM 7358]
MDELAVVERAMIAIRRSQSRRALSRLLLPGDTAGSASSAFSGSAEFPGSSSTAGSPITGKSHIAAGPQSETESPSSAGPASSADSPSSAGPASSVDSPSSAGPASSADSFNSAGPASSADSPSSVGDVLGRDVGEGFSSSATSADRAHAAERAESLKPGISPAPGRSTGLERSGELAGGNDRTLVSDPALFGVLDAIEEAGRPVTVGEIAAALGVDQPRASRLVARAVAEDLVVRQADQRDGRRTLLALTRRGDLHLEQAHRTRQAIFARAMEGWPAEDRATFARLLSSFTATLTNLT